MAETALTGQRFTGVTLDVRTAQGQPAQFQGVPVWASSNEAVLMPVLNDDGSLLHAQVMGPGGPEHLVATVDADMGNGVIPIVIIGEDVTVTMNPAQQAAGGTITMGTATDNPPATP